jgi:hypothetical protein
VVAEALRAAGEQVEVHDDHFARDASDETWLGKVGAKGWVVLSKDDRIRRNPVEREALIAAGIAAFFLGRSDLRGEQMAAALTAALPAIKKTLRRFSVPFIAGVSMSGDIHVFEDADQRFSPPKRIKDEWLRSGDELSRRVRLGLSRSRGDSGPSVHLLFLPLGESARIATCSRCRSAMGRAAGTRKSSRGFPRAA